MDLINEKDVEYNMDGLAADFFDNLKVCFSKNWVLLNLAVFISHFSSLDCFFFIGNIEFHIHFEETSRWLMVSIIF